MKHGMDMIFIEILQLNCYAVPELPPSRNPLHNCIYVDAICTSARCPDGRRWNRTIYTLNKSRPVPVR